jgi:adsorption protein B
VLAAMIEGNRARLCYSSCDFFIGVYPNDPATADVARQLTARFDNVHIAMCPHDGPTSKADCLNWTWQHMLEFEDSHATRFEVIVTHDAEDVIHPDALLWINWHASDYDMIQVPVLPLPTAATQWTHGVYCDEFSESQARDMPAREWMGAFVPSNGVGTGYRRQALEDLALTEANRIFDPACLTEDYENGLRLRLRGARQLFLDTGRGAVTTREYFPRDFRSAVKQRTRWVTGIALQTWDRHRWEGGIASKYWLWRDRKGLIGNPASLLTNAVLAYGMLSWLICVLAGIPWRLSPFEDPSSDLLVAGFWLAAYRIAFRAFCVGRRFGVRFALGIPVRALLANVINSLATACAVHQFVTAKLHRRPLRWLKTAHEYPTAQAILDIRRQRIGEVLVLNGYVTPEHLQEAVAAPVPGVRLGERLIELGHLDEDSLYEALSLQAGLPQGPIDAGEVPLRTARSLPSAVMHRLRIIPVKAAGGELVVAGPELPTDEAEHAVRSFTNLRPRFWLITPSNFETLVEALL